MIRLSMLLMVLLLFTGCVSVSPKKYHERYYQSELCNRLGGEMEYRLQDSSRIDCLTDDYAIEVDFAKKWAEGVGQSLYYAEVSKRKPAVGIIIDLEKERRYLKRLNLMAKRYGIRIFIIEKRQ